MSSSDPVGAVAARLSGLRQILTRSDLDALLVSQPENRRYLSGFTGSAGWLLVSQTGALLATDFRYFEQVELECPGIDLVRIVQGLVQTLPAMLEQASARRVGFEADHATFADVQAWIAATPDQEWSATQGLVSSLRAVKDGAEVVALRSAVRLADEALAAVLPRLRPGMPELEGAWLIESYLRQHGAEGLAFETIVAGGSNGARPHARASSAALPAGEPIVIDMGARVGGYCSDVTRTVCLGQPTDPVRFWEIYNLVLKAQGAAKSVARAGMTGRQVDSVARDVIAAAGYGANFGHSLGHGVGLAVHEEPLLSRRYEGLLAAGNVVTLEPGVYLPGWGGVRIEDMIVLNDEGAEVLTAAPKDPLLPIS